ncbi:MAG: 1-deoxy-D-xylulose-5-phosphate synthase [Rikenellaceae bacterium]
MSKYINQTISPNELRKLKPIELGEYCRELREFIIESVAENPGHLGSSLGAVEIAVALHYVFDTPHDRVVWDVGHQAYAHKIITGRKELFNTNRKEGGISGFPKRGESEYDCFGGGHASVSISAALGMARAVEQKGEQRQVVAVIGDGALTGGLAYEGLNNAAGSNMLVILNDNNISIDVRVGSMSEYLTKLTTSKGYNRLKSKVWNALGFWPAFRRVLQKIGGGAKSFFLHRSNIFEALGFRYFGPVDGNDIETLVKRFGDLKEIKGAKLLHVVTTKGKGYQAAEESQTEWHAPGKFDPKTAQKEPRSELLKYQDVFGHTLLELAHRDSRVVGITPAMMTGSSLTIMHSKMPQRVFDVGIAEGHAVTFSGGLATEGLLPFCVIYSTFAQRSIDNIFHDVVLQGVEVVLCLDRAGLVGEDGVTHHGIYDIAMLRSLPNIIISAPSSPEGLRELMQTASKGGYGSCFVIRYPRGGKFPMESIQGELHSIEIGKSRVMSEPQGAQVALLSLGTTYEITAEAAREIGAAHIDMIFVKPLDTKLLDRLSRAYQRVVVVEDGAINGGAGSAVRDYYSQQGVVVDVRSVGVGDCLVQHAKVSQLQEEVGLTVQKIIEVATLK